MRGQMMDEWAVREQRRYSVPKVDGLDPTRNWWGSCLKEIHPVWDVGLRGSGADGRDGRDGRAQ